MYIFTCSDCGETFERFASISKTPKFRKCRCGAKALRNIIAEHSSGNADSQMREYDFEGSAGTRLYPCAVLPNQISEARKKHPNIDWVERNGCFLPRVHNRREKLKILKQYGFVELD